MTVVKTLQIPDISCNHCVMRVERATKDLPGVKAVRASASEKAATYTLEREEDIDRVKKALAEIGYPAA